MSDTIVVMNQGYIQQIGTPERIYNEPENAFVADFIGESNIIPSLMLKDRLVKILGVPFAMRGRRRIRTEQTGRCRDPSGRYLPSQTG